MIIMPDILGPDLPPSPSDIRRENINFDTLRPRKSSFVITQGLHGHGLELAEYIDAGNVSRRSKSRISTNELGKRRSYNPLVKRGGAESDEDGWPSRLSNGRDITNGSDEERNRPTEDLEEALRNGDLAHAKGILSRAASSGGGEKDKILKLSPAKLFELISAPDSLPIQTSERIPERTPGAQDSTERVESWRLNNGQSGQETNGSTKPARADRSGSSTTSPAYNDSPLRSPLPVSITSKGLEPTDRPVMPSRAVSTPAMKRKPSGKPASIATLTTSHTKTSKLTLDTQEEKSESKTVRHDEALASPMPPSIPLPPMSIPAHLQLELSSNRPSPLYLHRPSSNDFPYESSQVKIERLINFFLLPPHLERVLWFGALACFDAWLYTFTILPLRFFKALSMLGRSWSRNLLYEVGFIISFIYRGLGRMWKRRTVGGTDETGLKIPATNVKVPRSRKASTSDTGSGIQYYPFSPQPEPKSSTKSGSSQVDSSHKRTTPRHRRTKSTPSSLQPADKADILKGFLILFSCFILMRFNASMMYHSIRGQAAIKLYVIYNALEVRVPRRSILRLGSL